MEMQFQTKLLFPKNNENENKNEKILHVSKR